MKPTLDELEWSLAHCKLIPWTATASRRFRKKLIAASPAQAVPAAVPT
jgi:hypothetical protein